MQLCHVVHCISIARLWHQLRLSKFGPLSCICICPGSLQILTICAQIPPHGRWRHLDAGRPRVEPLVAKWKASPNPPDTTLAASVDPVHAVVLLMSVRDELRELKRQTDRVMAAAAEVSWDLAVGCSPGLAALRPRHDIGSRESMRVRFR